MKLLKLTPDRLSGTRYFFHEGAPLPYLNGTVREKYGIFRYFTLNRIIAKTPNITEHYWTRYRTVLNMLPNSTVQYGTDQPNKLG